MHKIVYLGYSPDDLSHMFPTLFMYVYTHIIYLLESPTIFTSHSHVSFLVGKVNLILLIRDLRV